MHESKLPVPELSQEQLTGLVDLIGQAEDSPYASPGLTDPDDIWVPASMGAIEDTGRVGSLVIRRNPQSDPTAFLGVRYLENGFGDDRHETETLYTFSRGVNGVVTMKASDTVNGDPATRLIGDGADFDAAVKDHPDREMVATAKADMEAELDEAFTIEAQELTASLKPATGADFEKLKTLVGFALNGDKHDYKSPDQLWVEEHEARHSTGPRPRRVARVAHALRRTVRYIGGM